VRSPLNVLFTQITEGRRLATLLRRWIDDPERTPEELADLAGFGTGSSGADLWRLAAGLESVKYSRTARQLCGALLRRHTLRKHCLGPWSFSHSAVRHRVAFNALLQFGMTAPPFRIVTYFKLTIFICRTSGGRSCHRHRGARGRQRDLPGSQQQPRRRGRGGGADGGRGNGAGDRGGVAPGAAGRPQTRVLTRLRFRPMSRTSRQLPAAQQFSLHAASFGGGAGTGAEFGEAQNASAHQHALGVAVAAVFVGRSRAEVSSTIRRL